MKSSEDELANLLDTLRLRFGVTEELIKNFKDRDDGHYTRLACQAPFICANFKVVVSGIGGRIPRL